MPSLFRSSASSCSSFLSYSCNMCWRSSSWSSWGISKSEVFLLGMLVGMLCKLCRCCRLYFAEAGVFNPDANMAPRLGRLSCCLYDDIRFANLACIIFLASAATWPILFSCSSSLRIFASFIWRIMSFLSFSSPFFCQLFSASKDFSLESNENDLIKH